MRINHPRQLELPLPAAPAVASGAEVADDAALLVEYELREVIWPLTGECFVAKFPVEPAAARELAYA